MMNQDTKCDEPPHREGLLKVTLGLIDRSSLITGGAKRSHKSLDSNKEKPPLKPLDNGRDGR